MMKSGTPSRGFSSQPVSPPPVRRERKSKYGNLAAPTKKRGWVGNLTIFLQVTLILYIVAYQITFNNKSGSSDPGWTPKENNDPRNLVAARGTNCLPPKNQTVLEVDDLRLSCGAFRLENAPTMEEVFGYLGPQELEKAKTTKQMVLSYLKTGELRVDLGSGTSGDKYNVVPTDLPVVDLLNQTKLAAIFNESTVSAIRASHVWEHFTYPQAVKAMESIRCLLRPDGVARIATPDSYHPGSDYNSHKLKADFPDGMFNAKYRESSYPGHRGLWSAHKLAAVGFLTGLDARPLEWWDSNEILPEQRSFCEQPYDESKGFGIGRSAHNDKRNREHPLTYTSLIVDLMPQALVDQPWSSTEDSVQTSSM